MNKLLCDDYKNVITNYEYDYIFTSPPDFAEIGSSPDKPEEYQDFLTTLFSLANPRKNLITVAFTDRKFDGGIVSKHSILIHVMLALGWTLKTHKIWVKSTKVDLYRLTYGNVLTFGRGKTKQNMDKEFKPDVWIDGYDKYKGFQFGMPVDIPRKCIQNYTSENDIVYDPFMGSGTTAVAAIRTGRQYLGSELSEEYWKLSKERIESEENSIDFLL